MVLTRYLSATTRAECTPKKVPAPKSACLWCWIKSEENALFIGRSSANSGGLAPKRTKYSSLQRARCAPLANSALGRACWPTTRLRLVAAAHVRLAVATAVRRALALVQLGRLFFADLVGVVFDLAALRRLFVLRVLFVRHGGFFGKWISRSVLQARSALGG